MLTGQLALVVASLFSGAAVYITLVEQPARLVLDDAALLSEWKPAYKRGTALQGPLAILGFLLGMAAWWMSGQVAWIAGAILMLANWPVTLFIIFPTNRQLMAIDPLKVEGDVRGLIRRWASLHLIRVALGFTATACFLAGALSG